MKNWIREIKGILLSPQKRRKTEVRKSKRISEKAKKILDYEEMKGEEIELREMKKVYLQSDDEL